MGRIVRELKTVPGLVLGTTIALIVTLFIWNLLQTKAPAPISSGSGWVYNRITGRAYGGPAAPVIATAPGVSPYSYNSNLGPQI